VTAKFQVTIDCADPARLVAFWALALGYVPEEPPAGFAGWNAYWRSVGVPEDEIDPADTADSIVDPDGVGPRIWFQVVPEGKVGKNRLHLDVAAGGGRGVPVELRRQRVSARADQLVAAGATRLRVLHTEGLDHYGEVLQDPEGNEFCVH
jgi:Glyoxalase-like domain